MAAGRCLSGVRQRTAETFDPQLHRFTTFPLARGIRFWQALFLIRRARRFNAALDKRVGRLYAPEYLFAARPLRVGEGAFT